MVKKEKEMNTLKILAVDDEKNVLDMIAADFRDHQHYITTCETSAIEAIELAKENNFDIIMTDYQMPTVNGIELLEVVQELYENRCYVSILCTAHGTTYLFESELQDGLFQFFLEKPFTRETLQKAITKAVTLLEKKRSSEK